jgi:hypothetical protein
MLPTGKTLRVAAIAIGVLGFAGSASLAEDNADQQPLHSATTGSPSSGISLDGSASGDASAQADIPEGASVDSTTETANADAAADKDKTSR